HDERTYQAAPRVGGNVNRRLQQEEERPGSGYHRCDRTSRYHRHGPGNGNRRAGRYGASEISGIGPRDEDAGRNRPGRQAGRSAAAEANVTVTKAALQRANDLYAQKVITADEHETAIINAANATSQLVAAQAALSTAQQNLDYATLRSQVSGTVISKTAAVGTVVSSATSNVGGGGTILTVADLHHVRMQALVNETDVGNVHEGMPVSVTIDAFPGRTFAGTVEKVQPQAVIQNSVTMFPVLVSLPNTDLALLPGMNGEVSIITQQRRNVIAVPNDAVRSMKDAVDIGAELGISQDTMDALGVRRGGGGSGGGA